MDLVTASDTAELGVDTAEAMKKIQTFKDTWLEKMTAMNFDGTLVGILHTKNDSLADVVKDEGTEVLFGQDYFYEELLGLKFKITPFSFFQTNSLGAEVLYETARENRDDPRSGTGVDLFPGTYHVETVVLLSQQKPDDTIEIDLDLDELDATSAELKATYQEIKDYVLKEFGLKVSSLYISQVKRKCGIEVGENYNLPKSENARVPQCPKEKEDAIKAALKYFAMI